MMLTVQFCAKKSHRMLPLSECANVYSRSVFLERYSIWHCVCFLPSSTGLRMDMLVEILRPEEVPSICISDHAEYTGNRDLKGISLLMKD